ncbi:MAG: peroxiredoxin [Planctomycetota bacterium]|jgi:peroxiredoxin
MVRTASTMLELGTPAPDFTLNHPATNKLVRRDDFQGQGLLVVFSCNHCPYVLHMLESFSEFAREAATAGLAVVMINSNDVDHYPADSPPKMIELGEKYRFGFPYLYDPTQSVASAYLAACTPDFFLFDDEHRLVYRGQFDGSRPGNNVAIDGRDLQSAVTAILEGSVVPSEQTPSVGCSIKWKPGNEPV